MNINELLGKTLTCVEGVIGGDTMTFTTIEGKKYQMYHCQDCCERVVVEDICGELIDLIGSPITQAEESTNQDNPPEYHDSFTWTFYRLATAKGQVVLRWLGESNGYYSESVDFKEITTS
jgi:hypothetical protein